jgi:hypothetical protein
MNLNFLRFILLFVVSLAINLSLLCQQIEGESEVTTIIIKKPENSRSGLYDSNDKNINDISPPEIKIISPQVDTSFTAQISASNIYLIGRLTDQSGIQSLIINDSIIATDENGFFQQQYNLVNGLNVFKIDATDKLLHSCTKLVSLINNTTDVTLVNPDELIFKGENHALIIGINFYNDPALIDLDNPITDASLLYGTLIGNYMFDPANVTLLKNPTRADIIKKLDELSYTLTKNDNLLIFYAGHGFWDKEKETGFWLPADADQLSSVNWIRNSTIQDFVDEIKTLHTLLITDACFAGSIFKSRGGFNDASVAVNKLYSMTSRKAMTSGTLEEVPDRSVFLEYLLKRLQTNEKKYLSASELFNSFREAVLNNSPNIPQYGVIQDTGDEGGDFIFIKR